MPRAVRYGVVAFGAIVLMVALLWTLQRRFIFLPGGDPGDPQAGWKEVTLSTSDGLELAAWLTRPDPGIDRGYAVIVFPGNAGNRKGRTSLGENLRGEGFTVLLVDYRGYGGNPGAPSEAGLRRDADAAIAFAAEAGLGRKGVVYFGESLGTAVALEAAVRHPPDGVVLRSPFTSLADVARAHVPILPPVFLRDRFASLALASSIDVPVIVIAGPDDSLVPFSQSERMASALNAPLYPIGGADHNDPALASGPDLVDAVVEWFVREVGGPRSGG